MARKLTNKSGRSNNLWWITGGVVVIFALCGGALLVIRSFFPAAPTPLPLVPTYGFSTSTSPATFLPGIQTNTSSAIQSLPPSTLTSIPTSTLIPTPTNTSIFNWIFPNYYPTSTPYRSPTPLQAVLSTLTPSKTATTLPPPPTQGTASPIICKNILYPARPGNQWTYFVSTPKRSGNLNMRVLTVEGTQATVDVTDLTDGSVSRTYVQCDQDIILSFPFLNAQGLIGETVNGTMNVDYVGGVMAPNEAAFLSSNWALSWVSQYRVYGNGRVNYNGRDFNFTLDPSIVNLTCQTLASGDASFENITVTAGSFHALKVICRGDGQVTANLNGSQVTGSINVQATEWFAPKIGLLKSQSDYVLLNVFGISVPLTSKTIAGTIELINYTVAP
jgi:hypothetical protein